MALTAPRIVYGIHSFSAVKRSDGLPYGTAVLVGGSSISMAGELVKLTGGSSPYPWAAETSLITAEITLRVKSYEDWMFEVFLGKAPTSNAAEASGSASTLTNKLGTSTVHTDGIATATIESGEEASVKFARYTVLVVSATTVDVYASSDVDGGRGTDFTFQDNSLKITASALTISQSAATSIPGTGIELTGDSGTIGMTAGGTATFTTRAINTLSMDVDIGATSDNPPAFEAVMIAQQRSGGQMFEISAPNTVGVGMPMAFEENAFSEAEIKCEAFYDATLNKVLSIRSIVPT